MAVRFSQLRCFNISSLSSRYSPLLFVRDSLHSFCHARVIFLQSMLMPLRNWNSALRVIFIVLLFAAHPIHGGWCTGTQCTPEIAVLNPSPTVATGMFSSAIAIDGDYILSGMPAGSGAAGTVFAYYRNKGGWDAWGLLQSFQASDAASGMKFGTSVAISGNFRCRCHISLIQFGRRWRSICVSTKCHWLFLAGC